MILEHINLNNAYISWTLFLIICSSFVIIIMYISWMSDDIKVLLISNYNSFLFAVVTSIILIAITISGSRLFRRECNNYIKIIPGKLSLTETFSFLAATNSTRGCYDFVRLRRLRYGKWFRTRLFGKIHVFVPSVEGAKTVLSNDFVVFNKGYLKSMEDAVGKKSLLCVPKEIHTRIRHLLKDPFSMNSVSKFVPEFDRELSQRLRMREREGTSFRVLDFTMKVAFDGICDMLMSITDASTLDQLEKDVTIVGDSMLSFPVMIPGTKYYRGIKARKRVMETLRAIVKQRREGEEAREDLLGSMVQRESYPSEEKLEDEEILDNLLTLIVAGQSTTGAALMWCVKFLDENRQVQEKLREEQLSILKDKPDGALLKYEDLLKMSYASKVVKETLRMANVLLWYPRVALEDCKIEGYEIKKGWKVNIDATHIHYDPAIYKDPMRFDPSRFDEMQKPYSYIPFGSGPRTCLGINLAKATMLVFLHRLTSGYTWTVDDDDLSLEREAHIPRLQSGCPITLKAHE